MRRSREGNLRQARPPFSRLHSCAIIQPHEVKDDYMKTQGDVTEKMRMILVDWLVEVREGVEI